MKRIMLIVLMMAASLLFADNFNADINDDGIVDIGDLSILAAQWLEIKEQNMSWVKICDVNADASNTVTFGFLLSGIDYAVSAATPAIADGTTDDFTTIVIDDTTALWVDDTTTGANVDISVERTGTGTIVGEADYSMFTSFQSCLVYNQTGMTSLLIPDFSGDIVSNNVVITGNGLSATSLNTIIDAHYQWAIDNNKGGSSQVLDYRNNTGTDGISVTAEQEIDALLAQGWTINGETDPSVILTTGYDVQAMGLGLNDDYVAGKNIDMSVIANFISIGTLSSSFTGSLNGNGKKLSNLNILGSGKEALISYNAGHVFNLEIEGTVKTTGQPEAALIVAFNKSGGIVEYCKASGTAESSYSVKAPAGLVALNSSGGLVRYCETTVSLLGSPSVSFSGQICGQQSGSLHNCLAYNLANTTKGIKAYGSNYSASDNVGNYYLDLSTGDAANGQQALSESDFRNSSNFPGWDFVVVRIMRGDYPKLRLFVKTAHDRLRRRRFVGRAVLI